ncbi:hypothetical protein Y032_0665g1327 [Ancylostoma ceylanicum]|uniref:Uncharacterized protein n=1 Tax=Ancylostoma ceylanicum TaxID=53326 RepID=A0A016WHG5_9BILA|nr:hypothetical protein Y032_0665g1327 [Ancylostoma ceylanicum]
MRRIRSEGCCDAMYFLKALSELNPIVASTKEYYRDDDEAIIIKMAESCSTGLGILVLLFTTSIDECTSR